MRNNYKRSAPEIAGKLACAIGRAKKVAVSKSREIGRVAYLGLIMNIGSGRARKFKKERSGEGLDISVYGGAREKCCRLRIARNCVGGIFRPNNEYRKRSCVKI